MDKFNIIDILLDVVPISIIITDLEGNIVFVNSYFEKLSGYTSQEVIGKNPRFLKSGKHSENEYKNLWDTILSGGVFKSTICNKNKNGNLYWQEVVVSPVFDDEGTIKNFVSIQMDITKFREEKLRLDYIINSMEELYIILNDNYQVENLLYNPKLFNINEDEYINKHINEIFDPETAGRIQDIFTDIEVDKDETGIVYVEMLDRTLECIIKRYNSSKFIIFARDISDKLKFRVLEQLKNNISSLINSNNKVIQKLEVDALGDN